MPVERASGGSSLIDVLDRILDKGIVIDAWVRVSVVGIDLVTVTARVVVASMETFIRYTEAAPELGLGLPASAAAPPERRLAGKQRGQRRRRLRRPLPTDTPR